MNANISLLIITVCGVIFTGFLTGCTSQVYKPFYSGKIIALSSKELDQYWTLDNKAGNSNAIGCFKVKITIDSNGRIVDPAFVKMIGPSSPRSWLLDFLSEQQFTPTSTNPNRIPVRTTKEWALVSGEMDTQQHAIGALTSASRCFDALTKSNN